LQGEIGPFSGEGSAAYRKWRDRYFSDGLEKGPAAIGFGRISFERGFFIPDLSLGASIELQAASRRDYRSLRVGLTDAYTTISGRVVFSYKDFTFYFNEDNLTGTAYYPLWPYPGAPRALWWEFRWNFFD